MSRIHPFEVLAEGLPDGWLAQVRAAEEQGRDLSDLMQFHDLTPVREVLRQLNPPGGEAPAMTVAQYETLLYVAYRFWSAGRHTAEIPRADLERALTTDRPTDRPAVPHGACYIRLPERLFWARIDDQEPPEPLDGLFLASGGGDRDITILAVLGLRPERDGFSQIAVTVPPRDLPRAAGLVRRPLFASVLEGGDRAGVKSVVSEAELLHLAHLALSEVER